MKTHQKKAATKPTAKDSESSSLVQETAPAALSSVGAFEAKTHLSALLEKVGQGHSFIITKHGKAIAELKPVAAAANPRKLGQWAGQKFWMAPDFDAPLEDFKDYTE